MRTSEAPKTKDGRPIMQGPVSLEEHESLLDCPFCGSTALMKIDSGFNSTRYWVKCSQRDCGITVQSLPDRAKVVEKWNTRVS